MLCKANIVTFISFIIVIFLGCSEIKNGSSIGTGQKDTTSTIEEKTPIEALIGAKDIPSIKELQIPPSVELEYMKQCYKEEWYFCPPLDAVWQFNMVVDICKDPPQVISVGECTEKFECDPSNDSIETIECVVDDGEGIQEKWCDKGLWKYTDCSSCNPEVCNNKDDDCDGEIDEDIAIITCENECGPGDLICVDGAEECFGPEPQEEVCDGADNDCDGDIDEGFENIEEVCNNIDDNCNGIVDEGDWECDNGCGPGPLLCVAGEELCIAGSPGEEICDGIDNDCDGEIDENQLNDCGDCGPVSQDVCNGFDDDCDGNTDEDLIQECSTLCGNGIEVCSLGGWIGCSAKQPIEEICNGFDDNCDGQIDEGLDCLCTIDLVGVLFPCFEAPLQCGGGYKSCVCEDTECKKLTISPCYAQCYWEKPYPSDCYPLLGYVESEMCNNHDDNCNQLVDEGLTKACYSGPPDTLYVGICLPGELMCHKGEWGNNYITDAEEEIFIPNLCLNEVVPAENDACNGADDNCDGVVDDGNEMEDTDILFIVDWSGSMQLKIEAVMTALNMFAAHYSDQEVIKWGLVIGPVVDDLSSFPPIEYLHFVSPLSEFPQFMALLSALDLKSVNGGAEMLYDAVYLAVQNLVPASMLPWLLSDLSWLTFMQNVNSLPQLDQFAINWRDDAHHVVIVFTDEEGQSYLYKGIGTSTPEYGLLQEEILEAIGSAVDLYVYTFTPETLKQKTTWGLNGKKVGWEPLTQFNGKWFTLTSSATIMYESLLEILDETACSEN